MFKLRKVSIYWFVAALLLGLNAQKSLARGWVKYENSHFVAYSNAKKKRVMALMTELELFRAAVLQLSNITIPIDAPKTKLIITRSRREFQKLAGSKNTAGYAMRVGSGSLLVMPAGSNMKNAKDTIRHEYTHALLRYKKFPYPNWYEEGFAELAAATEVNLEDKSFHFGGPSYRSTKGRYVIFDWEDLVADYFSPHLLNDFYKGTSAYFQAWILTHYLTLGDNFSHAGGLQAYFDGIRAGQNSIETFENIFGMTPEQMWDKELANYINAMPMYTMKFSSELLDMNFSVYKANPEDYEPMVNYLKYRSLVRNKPKLLSKPLRKIAGLWGDITLKKQCENTVSITLDKKSSNTFLAFNSSYYGLLSNSYSYQLRDKGFLYLTPNQTTIASTEGGDAILQETLSAAELGLFMPRKDLICVTTSQGFPKVCKHMLVRCD